jgi:hypothetical protein
VACEYAAKGSAALSGALSKEMQNSVLVQNSLISKHQKMLEAAKQETAGKEQVGAHPQRMHAQRLDSALCTRAKA